MIYTAKEISYIAYKCNKVEEIKALQDYIYENVKEYSKYQIQVMFNVLQGRYNYLKA